MSEFAKDVDGFLLPNEQQFLYEHAKKATLPILEIGSFKGKSTVCLAKGSKDGNNVKVYAVDPHTGAEAERKLPEFQGKPTMTYPIFKENIKKKHVDDVVVPIVKFSEEAAKGWTQPLGMVWVDGDHSYEMASLDFKLWSKHLVSGGLIAFHDSTNPEFGVEKMIRDHILPSPLFTGFSIADGIFYAYKGDKLQRYHRIKIKAIIFSIKLFRKIPIPSSLNSFIKNVVKKIVYSWR